MIIIFYYDIIFDYLLIIIDFFDMLIFFGVTLASRYFQWHSLKKEIWMCEIFAELE